jgi:hypothetical protein
MMKVRSLVAALAAGGLAASCVAAEPYKGQQTDGGHAGRGGSLQLEPSGGSPDGQAGTTSGGTGGQSPPDDPECRTSAECALPRPYCAGTLGQCVECLSKANCSGTGRAYCKTTTYTCVRCLADTQCKPGAPYCETTEGVCVACLSSTNCGARGACDRNVHECVPACDSDADCEGSPTVPVCDPERNVCVQCLGDGDCPTSLPHCSPKTERCVSCLSDDDCASPTAHCDPLAQACVACLSSADCPGGVACVDGACVGPK